MTDPETGTEPDPDPEELLAAAREAAAAAVSLIVDERPTRLRVSDKSTSTDHVTEMDVASENRIREILGRLRPADALLGEEHGGDLAADGVTWIIDPIDGTTNYLYDHPGYAVSVAAWVGGEPLVGVVADPTHRRTYWARRGAGSFCESGGTGTQRLALADPPPLERMLVATGFGYEPSRRAKQAEVVAELISQVRDIRRMGAAAVDMCSVAAGRVDAYYEAGLSIWDLAAGQLIATEAGAAVEAIEGGPPKPGSVLVCHPDRIDSLRSLLLSCGIESTLT